MAADSKGMATQDEVFETRVDALVQFAQHQGTAPSRSSDSTTERALGEWFARARSRHRRGLLTGHQQELFERRIPKDLLRTDQKWFATLAALSEFHHARGHFPNRDSDSSDERRLSSWLGHQRETFRQGAMPPAKMDALDAAVPGWDSGHDDRWSGQLRQLKRHLAAHDGALPKAATPLGQWLYRQRARLADGSLRPERLQLLDATGCNWDLEAADMEGERKGASC